MNGIAHLRLVSQQSSEDQLMREAKCAAVDALRRLIELQLNRGTKFDDYESTALKNTNEVTRELLEQRLQQTEHEFSEEVLVRGERYRRHEPGVVSYHSLCGDLIINRYSYRLVKERNGPTIIPLELKEGIIERATPAFAFAVAQGFAKMPSRHFEEEMRSMYRQPPSRSTLERLGKYIGGAASQDAVEIESTLRKKEQLPKGAYALSVGLDRTTVPMIEERPPSQPPSSRRKKRHKPYVRRPPDPFDVVYRMAYVGTVSIVDESGEALVTRRYAATPEQGPDELVSRVMADVTRTREQNCKLPIVLVQDGAPELWGLMWEAFGKAGIKDYHQAIDRFHVNERIAALLDAVFKDDKNRRVSYDHWQNILDVKYDAPEQLERWARSQVEKSSGVARQLFSSLSSYIGGNERRMRYALLRRRNLPSASSITEGACKSLVTMRTKRSGQRWYHDGLNAVLTLRAIYQSDRFGFFWNRFVRRYEAKIRCTA
jgi:hypothetical protein